MTAKEKVKKGCKVVSISQFYEDARKDQQGQNIRDRALEILCDTYGIDILKNQVTDLKSGDLKFVVEG